MEDLGATPQNSIDVKFLTEEDVSGAILEMSTGNAYLPDIRLRPDITKSLREFWLQMRRKERQNSTSDFKKLAVEIRNVTDTVMAPFHFSKANIPCRLVFFI